MLQQCNVVCVHTVFVFEIIHQSANYLVIRIFRFQHFNTVFVHATYAYNMAVLFPVHFSGVTATHVSIVSSTHGRN